MTTAADLLDVGSLFLQTQSRAQISRTVTYRRGLASVTLVATLGSIQPRTVGPDGNLKIERLGLDFLITASDLILNGVSTSPKRGDNIDVVFGSTVKRYEVVATGDEPVYRYSNSHQYLYRVHTKYASIPSTAVPPPPAGVTATAGVSIVVSWVATLNAQSYNVYRGASSGGETVYASGVTTTSYTDTAVTPGTVYYYKVTAVDSIGESAQSAEVSCAAALNYYIKAAGNDSNTGLSDAQAWQTVGKVNGRAQSPGDIYNFNGGDTFAGPLIPNTSGTALQPIAFTSYGTGQATITGGNLSPVLVKSASFVTINNLALSGSGVSSGGVTTCDPWTAGVWAQNTSTSTKSNTNVTNCTISGCWGGVVFTSIQADVTNLTFTIQTGQLAGWDSCNVTGNTISGCAVYGVKIWGIPTAANGGQGSETSSTYLCTNFNVNDNIISTCYGDSRFQNSGYGILFTQAKGMTCLRNVVHDNGSANPAASAGGPVGIMAYYTDTYRIAYNHVYNQGDPSRIDGEGIDADGHAVNGTIEFNYCHDNVGQDFYCLTVGGVNASDNNVFRYNISANSGTNTIAGVSGFRVVSGAKPPTNLQVYNNLFYLDHGVVPNGAQVVNWGLASTDTTCHFSNNIVISRGASGTVELLDTRGANPPNIVGNLWDAVDFRSSYNNVACTSLAALQAQGCEKIGGTLYGVQGSALVQSPGFHGTRFPVSGVVEYNPTWTSAAIAAGVNLQSLFSINPGLLDFHGNVNSRGGTFDIGPVQSQIAAPTSLTASYLSTTGLSLAWTAPAGTGLTYNIYRGTAPNGEANTAVVTGVVTNSYTDSGLTANTRYYYRVTAVSAGVESPQSNEAYARTALPETNGSLVFTGANSDYVSGAMSTLNGAGTGTLLFWIKNPDAATTNYIISFPQASGGSNGLDVTGGAHGQGDVTTSGTSGSPIIPNGWNDGAWHHVAITWDGAHATAYLDGVAGTQVNCTGNLIAAANEFNFMRFGTLGRFANGSMTMVAVLPGTVVSAANIALLAAGNLRVGSLSFSTTGEFWPFNDASGAFVTGIKNGNNGTLHGSPLPQWSNDYPAVLS